MEPWVGSLGGTLVNVGAGDFVDDMHFPVALVRADGGVFVELTPEVEAAVANWRRATRVIGGASVSLDSFVRNATSGAQTTGTEDGQSVEDRLGAGGGPSPSDVDPQPPGVAVPGVSNEYSRGDHVHEAQAIPAAPSPSDATPQPPGTAAPGDSADYSRANHVHEAQSIPAAPSPSDASPLAPAITAVAGVSEDYSRADHVHLKREPVAALSSPAANIAWDNDWPEVVSFLPTVAGLEVDMSAVNTAKSWTIFANPTAFAPVGTTLLTLTNVPSPFGSTLELEAGVTYLAINAPGLGFLVFAAYLSPAGVDARVAMAPRPASGINLRTVRGFSASNFFQSSTIGSLAGGGPAGWDLMVVAIANTLEGGASRELVSTHGEFVGPGYRVGVSGLRATYSVNGSSRFTGSWARDSAGRRLVVLRVTFDPTVPGGGTGTRRLYINGILRDTATGAYAPPVDPTPFRVGANAQNASNPSTDCGIVGIGFDFGGPRSETQRQADLDAIIRTGRFDASAWPVLYDAADLDTGAAAATWANSGTQLAPDLTRAGALTVQDEAPLVLALEQNIAPDDIVVRVGGIRVSTQATISAVGPTTVASSTVFANTAANAVGLDLPQFAPPGSRVRVQDTGNAGTNAITVNGQGGQLINGAASVAITTDYGQMDFVFDGSNWFAG